MPGTRSGRRDILPYLFVIPAVLLISVLVLYPIVLTLVLSFEKVTLTGVVIAYVGFGNFWTMFHDPIFWQVLGNSIYYTAVFVTVEIIVALGIALLLNQRVKGTRLASTLMLAPWVMPYVAVAYIWEWIFNNPYGIFNAILVSLDIIPKGLTWLGMPSTSLDAIILATVWKLVPFMAIIFFAGLQSVRAELYESAEVDGAGVWVRFRVVTFPGIRNLFFLMLFLATVWSFGQWDLPFLMTDGGPLYSSTNLALYSYQEALQEFNIGYGASISTFLFLILSVFAVIYVSRARIR
jgi:multiple sugar transport system permease protein